MTFEEFVIDVQQSVVRVGQAFTEPEDDWSPVALIENDKGGLVVVGLFLPKDQWPAAIKAIVRKEKASHAAAVLSSWTVGGGPEAAQDALRWKAQGRSLADHPNRKEILFLDIASANRHELYSADIIRHDGAPPTLGEWEKINGLESGGMLGNVVSGAFEQAPNAYQKQTPS